MEIIGLIGVGLLFIMLLVIERVRLLKARKTFQHVIHVGGTRGKTSVTRLIGAALREAGYRPFTKVTGTTPAFIDPGGNEHTIKRVAPANIREQGRMMLSAKRAHANCLVIECMAIREPLIHVTQHRMLQANHVVITNLYDDHAEEGRFEHSQQDALRAIVPKDGALHVQKHDAVTLKETIASSNAFVHTVTPYDGETKIDPHAANIGAALSVTRALNIDDQVALKGMKQAKKDVGALDVIKSDHGSLINAFSANDTQSLNDTFATLKKQHRINDTPYTILINNRLDRPLRAKTHLNWLKTQPLNHVYVAGPFYHRFKRALNVPVKRVKSLNDLPHGPIIGMGNLQGFGKTVVHYYAKHKVMLHG